MNEVPTWWLVASGAFYVLGSLVMIGLIVVGIEIVKLLRDVKPKIDAMSDRIESIGEQVESIATSTKTTLATVGGRAQSVATSVDAIAHVASKQFERFSPFLVGALTAIRLFKALTELRSGKSVAKATSKEVLDEDSRDGKKKVDKKARAKA